jgi:hypothetical protein
MIFDMAKVKSRSKPVRKDPNVYPPGWNYERVKAIADFYDSQTEIEMLQEIELAISTGSVSYGKKSPVLRRKQARRIIDNKQPTTDKK